MYSKVEQIFYYSAGIFLFLILFLVQPSAVAQTTELQEQVQKEFAVVLFDLVKQSEPLADLGLIWGGVEEFYSQSSVELIALLEIQDNPPEVERMIDHVAFAVTQLLNFSQPTNNYPVAIVAVPLIRADFEAPLSSVSQFDPSVDSSIEFKPNEVVLEHSDLKQEPQVAGSSTSWSKAVNDATRPWVTLKDNVTGQNYCVSIYNNEVNKYQGECKYDYY